MSNGSTAYPVVRELDLDLVAKGMDAQATAAEIFQALWHLMGYSGLGTDEKTEHARCEAIQKLSDRLIKAFHLPAFTMKNCDEYGNAALVTPPLHLIGLAKRAMEIRYPRYAAAVYFQVCHQMLVHPDDHAMELALKGMKSAADALAEANCATWAHNAYTRLANAMKDPRQRVTLPRGMVKSTGDSLHDLAGISHTEGYWESLRSLLDEIYPETGSSTESRWPKEIE